MAKPLISLVLLPLLLITMESSAIIAFASPADVNIYNMMMPGESFQLHCESSWGFDVVHEQWLPSGQHIGFGFTPNILGTTKYSCDFRWGAMSQHFNVWVGDSFFTIGYRKRPCKHCVWSVGRDGFFRSEAGHVDEVFVHPWVRK